MSALPKVAERPAGSALSSALIDRLRESATIEELRELYKFQREIEADANRAAYDDDFAKMQAELPEAPERGRIPSFKPGTKAQPYAKWEDISKAIKPAMTKYGFALQFRCEIIQSNTVLITAILGHRLGHREQTSLPLPFDTSGSKNAVQSVGSSISYGKRYTAGLLLNYATRDEDDDGTGTAGRLTDEQIGELRAAIVATGSDIARFCKVYGIERVEDLPVNMYAAAKGLLDAKRAPRDAEHGTVEAGSAG